MTASKSWQEVVDPIAKKCELAAMLKQRVEFNSEGAEALAGVLRDMARCLDRYAVKPR